MPPKPQTGTRTRADKRTDEIANTKITGKTYDPCANCGRNGVMWFQGNTVFICKFCNVGRRLRMVNTQRPKVNQ